MNNPDMQIYWRPDVNQGVAYTLEKLALEYREQRIRGETVLKCGTLSGPDITFTELLRRERRLQKMIGTDNLPETLDPKRTLLEELWYRLVAIWKVVYDGDFSTAEFVRRLENLEVRLQREVARAEQEHRAFLEEQKLNDRLQMGCAIACRALQETVAGLEFSLSAPARDRESLAASLHETLSQVLVVVGDKNSSLVVTKDAVRQLSLLYQAERDSRKRLAELKESFEV